MRTSMSEFDGLGSAELVAGPLLLKKSVMDFCTVGLVVVEVLGRSLVGTKGV